MEHLFINDTRTCIFMWPNNWKTKTRENAGRLVNSKAKYWSDWLVKNNVKDVSPMFWIFFSLKHCHFTLKENKCFKN